MSEPAPVTEREEAHARSLWANAWRRLRRDRLAMVCLAIIGVYLGVAVLCAFNLVAPRFDTPDWEHTNLAPSWEHLGGTDFAGRDVFGRVLHGAKIAIGIGFLSSLVAALVGTLLGALAGYFGGLVDELIVWLYSTVSSIPQVMLIIALSYILGAGFASVFLAIGLSTWVTICRLVRAEFMKLKEQEFVQAIQAMGGGHARVIFHHILPNVFHIIIVNFTLLFVYAIKTEVILSYLGVGLVEEPSWGIMINDGAYELDKKFWWQITYATGGMFGLVLAFQVFGDALRDALDPKLNR